MVFEWLMKNQTPSRSGAEEIVQRLEKTRTERELALREALVERKNAYKLAEAKERLNWLLPTGALTALFSGLAAFHHKNVFYSLPIIPIIGLIGHQAHLAYGNKLTVILDLAEKVIADSEARLSTRPISIREIEARVEQQKMATVMSCVDLMGTAFSHDNNADIKELVSIFEEQIQKQVALRNLQFEQDQAFQKAKLAESFGWEFLGSSTTILALIYCAQRYKNRLFAVPTVPLVMYLGYRYNETFGEHEEKIRLEAERLLATQRNLFTPIGGPITLAELDKRRAAWNTSKTLENFIKTIKNSTKIATMQSSNE
uniref:Uncharacterized protein n=2 Tax=Panagrolaimus sp. JU765 TaxID=591449 RepID=A0AC34QA69_9BILA